MTARIIARILAKILANRSSDHQHGRRWYRQPIVHVPGEDT
jgi:hypothetical protein